MPIPLCRARRGSGHTRIKKAEEEKQKSFTLVEYSRDFIAAVDLLGNAEYTNPARRALLAVARPASHCGRYIFLAKFVVDTIRGICYFLNQI